MDDTVTGEPMNFVVDKSKPEKYMWRHKSSKRKCSIRTGSFFEGRKISIYKIFMLAANFIENFTKRLEDVADSEETDFKTVVVYWQLFRDLCQNYFEREVIGKDVLLGGPGRYVEIDETLLFKAKYHRGRGLNRDQIWVFGMIERGTNNVAMFPVEQRDRSTLLPIIEKYVAAGTTIVSDGWKAYLGIPALTKHYTHKFVNHNVNFVDPNDAQVHTQSIEATWGALKKKLKAHYGLAEHKLPGYLFNYMFRRRLDNKLLLNNLIKEMAFYVPDQLPNQPPRNPRPQVINARNDNNLRPLGRARSASPSVGTRHFSQTSSASIPKSKKNSGRLRSPSPSPSSSNQHSLKSTAHNSPSTSRQQSPMKTGHRSPSTSRQLSSKKSRKNPHSTSNDHTPDGTPQKSPASSMHNSPQQKSSSTSSRARKTNSVFSKPVQNLFEPSPVKRMQTRAQSGSGTSQQQESSSRAQSAAKPKKRPASPKSPRGSNRRVRKQ